MTLETTCKPYIHSGALTKVEASAAEAARRFIEAAAALLRTPASHLEPPTVTRYQEGEEQRKHFDGRPAGDPSGLQEFMAAGGQRLVQVGVGVSGLGRCPRVQGLGVGCVISGFRV